MDIHGIPVKSGDLETIKMDDIAVVLWVDEFGLTHAVQPNDLVFIMKKGETELVEVPEVTETKCLNGWYYDVAAHTTGGRRFRSVCVCNPAYLDSHGCDARCVRHWRIIDRE